MNILDYSIQAAGGVTALANALDLEPNVISMWRKRGIPDSWARLLELMRRHGEGVFYVTNVMSQDHTVAAESQTV